MIDALVQKPDFGEGKTLYQKKKKKVSSMKNRAEVHVKKKEKGCPEKLWGELFFPSLVKHQITQ